MKYVVLALTLSLLAIPGEAKKTQQSPAARAAHVKPRKAAKMPRARRAQKPAKRVRNTAN
jgi:hypothetical protein